MFEAYMTAYPWDLVDGDLEAVLDDLHGRIGITGLSVWLASAPLVRIGTCGGERRVFSTDGGLLFRPASQHVGGLDCTSIASSWLGDRHPLAHIREACAQRGLKLHGRLPLATTGRIAGRYPNLATRNAFGSVSQRSICPVNPAAQSYLTALAELFCGNHDPAALIATDVYTAWTEAWAPELQIGPAPGRRQRALLAVCFCESCMENACRSGVDASAARDAVRAELDGFLNESVGRGEAGGPSGPGRPTNSGDAPTSGDLTGSDGPRPRAQGVLLEYLTRQSTQLGVLINGIRAACGCEVVVERSPNDPNLLEPTTPEELNDVKFFRHVEREEPLTAASDSRGSVGMRFGATLASGAHGDWLISAVQEMVRRGVSTVEFDDYGLLSDNGLDVIRRAIRYARRTSDG